MSKLDIVYDGFKRGEIDMYQAHDDNHEAAFDPNDYVAITKRHFESLVEDSDWLGCLENAGVENWPGIDCAYDLKEEGDEQRPNGSTKAI